MRKWWIVWLHWKGHNVHGYWTGSSWTHNREHAILYPGDSDARTVLQEMPIPDANKLLMRVQSVFVDFREV